MTGPAARPPTVAVLGTGTMGLPMAVRMLDSGLEVRAWNRNRGRAEPLAQHGAEVHATAAAAVSGADVIVTILADADAVLQSMDGPHKAVSAAGEQAIWAQMSTVGIAGLERCQELADEHGLALVDAPVLGTKAPAEQGELQVLASGPQDAVERCRPVFDAVGKQTLELGGAGAGTRLKLVLNHWLLAMVEGLAETVALAEALEVDPRRFLETIDGGPLNSPYAQLKGQAMVEREFEPSFSVRLARKDCQLVLDAAGRAGIGASLAEVVTQRLGRTIELGHGDEDLAATYWASAEGIGKTV